MPPILINVLQGFSARVRPEWTTVSHMVKHALAPYKDEVLVNIENPGDRHCIRRSLNFLNQPPSHVILIGKSLGGVRTWWLVKNHVRELEGHLSVSVIFVDPHGWQVGDGMIGSYGRNRAFPYCNWETTNSQIIVSQQFGKILTPVYTIHLPIPVAFRKIHTTATDAFYDVIAEIVMILYDMNLVKLYDVNWGGNS